MIYLLWALLNIGLFLFFVVICIKATTLIKKQLGLLPSVVFAFALLSFTGGPGSQKVKEQFDLKADNNAKKTRYSNGEAIAHLDHNMIFSIELIINYNKGGDYIITPISARPVMNGLIAGHIWKAGNIRATADGKVINYVVDGSIDWKLLGFNVYTEHERYTGHIDAP